MFTSLIPFTDLARDARCYSNTFLEFPHWYEYLDVDRNNSTGVCQVVNFQAGFPGNLTLIAMAVLDMALYIAGLVAVGFVVYGAIQYVTSRGEPEGIKNAQNTILNALIGLVIAMVSTGVVHFIGDKIK